LFQRNPQRVEGIFSLWERLQTAPDLMPLAIDTGVINRRQPPAGKGETFGGDEDLFLAKHFAVDGGLVEIALIGFADATQLNQVLSSVVQKLCLRGWL